MPTLDLFVGVNSASLVMMEFASFFICILFNFSHYKSFTISVARGKYTKCVARTTFSRILSDNCNSERELIRQGNGN